MGYNRHFWPRFPALSSILGYIMVKIRPRPDLNSFLSRIVAKSWAGSYLPAFIEENIVESELSVEQMADAMGMSRANLYRRLGNLL